VAEDNGVNSIDRIDKRLGMSDIAKHRFRSLWKLTGLGF
jgi:hypothetical protein